jgi:hypothetical protein
MRLRGVGQRGKRGGVGVGASTWRREKDEGGGVAVNSGP